MAPPLYHIRDRHDSRLLGAANEHDQDAAHLRRGAWHGAARGA